MLYCLLGVLFKVRGVGERLGVIEGLGLVIKVFGRCFLGRGWSGCVFVGMFLVEVIRFMLFCWWGLFFKLRGS